MAALGVLLLEGGLEKNLANLSLVFFGYLGLPVLGHDTSGLDGGKLAHAVVLVCCEDLDEQQETLGMRIVVFLKLSRGGLDPLCISCGKKTS